MNEDLKQLLKQSNDCMNEILRLAIALHQIRINERMIKWEK